MAEKPALKEELTDKSDGKELPTEKGEEDETEEEDDAIYEYLWKLVASLVNDPYPLFAAMTSKIINRIRTEVRRNETLLTFLGTFRNS